MAVPDTNTFSLQDVVDEVNPATEDLQACFAAAVDWKFDPAYKGDKDNLLNFRNYGGNKIADIEGPDIHQSVYVTGIGWSSVRGAATGTLDPTTGAPSVMQQFVESPSADHYSIHRNFMEFDLSSIPSSADIVSAYLEFRAEDEYSGLGTNDIYVVRATFGISVADIDYDSFVSDTFFSGSKSERDDGYGNKVIRKNALTGDLNNIKNYFGGSIKLCIRHIYDYDDNAPSSGEKIGYSSWRSGESLTGRFTVPLLHIVYK